MGKLFAHAEEQVDIATCLRIFAAGLLAGEEVRLVVMKNDDPCFFLKGRTMLNQALKHLRRYHGMKQQELAAKLGISNTYLSEIESGAKAHAITVDLLNRYSDVFKVPVSTLLLFSEQLDSAKRSDRLRVAMAGKVLKMLEWIDQHEKRNEQAA